MIIDSCVECGELLPPKATTCACGWKSPRPDQIVQQENRLCAWTSHGIRCGKAGSLSNARGTQGQWYCAEHFFGKHSPKHRRRGMIAVAELQQQLQIKRPS